MSSPEPSASITPNPGSVPVSAPMPPAASPGESRPFVTPGKAPPPGWQRYVFFGMVVGGLIMSSIDATIVGVGIPTFVQELNTNLIWVGWVITAYQLVQAIMMPTVGKLSDVLGRKQIFLICIALFGLGSLLCSLSNDVYFLIFARVIQAIGGGGLGPSATGIVADLFPDKRAQMLGLFTSVIPMGGIIGPNLGGFILANYSWRALFWVNLPITVVIFICILLFLKYDRAKSTSKLSLDLPGTTLYTAGIVSLMYAVTELGNGIDPSAYWQVGLLALAGIGFLVLFVRQEGRSASPLVDVRLLKERAFVFSNAFNFFYGACVFGFFQFIPLFATDVYHFNTFESGAILTPRALCMIGMSTVSSIYIIRRGYRLPLIGGMALVSLSLFLMGQGWTDVSILGIGLTNFEWLAIAIGIAGIGTGISAPPASNAVLDLMPEKIASVSGLQGVFRLTGGIFGVSLIVMVLNGQADQAAAMKEIFVAISITMFAGIALAFGIPDLARQRYRAGQTRIATHATLED